LKEKKKGRRSLEARQRGDGGNTSCDGGWKKSASSVFKSGGRDRKTGVRAEGKRERVQERRRSTSQTRTVWGKRERKLDEPIRGHAYQGTRKKGTRSKKRKGPRPKRKTAHPRRTGKEGEQKQLRPFRKGRRGRDLSKRTPPASRQIERKREGDRTGKRAQTL